MREICKYLFLVPLFAAFLASCSVKEAIPADDGEPVVPGREGLLRAYVESARTKGNVEYDSGLFTWSEGDKIAVWTKENGYLPGELSSGSGTGTGSFDIALHDATRDAYAIYPEAAAYEGAPGRGGAPLAIALPAIRRINNSKTGWDKIVEMPMVAVNKPGQDLQFKYTCAMVRFTLKNVPSTTRFIRVMADRSLAGYFVVDTTDTSAPVISSDNSPGGGNLSYVVFQFNSNVSGTVTVNLPVPGGVHYNLVVSTHQATANEKILDALRPGAAYSRGTSRFSIGEQRDYERGIGYYYELDCSTGVASSIDTFSVPDASVYETESVDLGWSIKRNNAGNEPATIDGLIINCYVEDPEIAHVQVVPNDILYNEHSSSRRPIIRLKGLKEGTTRLVCTAIRGENILTAISTVTVKKRGYHVYFRAADKVLTGGSTPLTAIFRRDGFETTADSCEWTITEGADFATIDDGTDQQHKWLHAGTQEGTVTVVCKVTHLGIEVTSEPVSIRIMEEAPSGAIRGLFTVDQAFNNVFFSRGNLFYNSTADKYSFFDSQIGYYLHKSKPSGKPNTQEMADLFNEREVPVYWHGHPMNQSIVYSDFDSEEFTTGWYGLTVAEWDYLLFSRRGVTLNGVANARFSRCTVKNESGTNIRCIMLFPDGYVHPDGIPFPGSVNVNNTSGDSAGYARIYTMAQMLSLQDAGVVFLPLTGTYEGSYQYSLSGGLYYTSTTGQTSSNEAGCQAKGFYRSYGSEINTYTPGTANYYFYSVRLVRRY